MSTILKSKKWCQALQFCSSDDPKTAETPLRKLIKKMPSIAIIIHPLYALKISAHSAGAAKLVFKHCVQEKKIADKRGSYYKEIHYTYDYIEDFQCLFSDQGPKIRNNPGDCENEESRPQAENAGNP